jgi:diguanylate cyclase (GGDEF)-like protein
MIIARVRSFIMRHKLSLRDLSMLLAAFAVATFLAFEVDIFAKEDTLSRHQKRIDLDETLLLGGLLAVGLLIFAARRYSEQKREMVRRVVAERQARELAYQDPLTGLPNRRQFDEALKAAVAAPPRAGAAHGLFLLDLNGFKQINDMYGHGAGDEVLVGVAERLLRVKRDEDMVARLGGDEFAILAHHLAGPEAATNVALRVIEALGLPLSGEGISFHVGVGIGVALLPKDAQTPQEALRKADVALYRAKAQHRSALCFFEEQMDCRVREREQLERALREALASGAIHPIYQPTFDLKTRTVVGFEAVPQWIHPTEGEIPSERFIAIAEEAGLLHDLADQMLRQACATAIRWPASIRLSMDIYPVQLKDNLLASRILRTLVEIGLSTERFEVEITESALVADLEAAQTTLGSLREAGVSIALDNFGTGYSSLYHLRAFKLDKIKIDRSFIDSLGAGQESEMIVNALVGLGHGLGLTIAAEGIEDSHQELSLLGTGCQQGQGTLLGEAILAETTLAFFPENRFIDTEILKSRSGKCLALSDMRSL